MALYLFKGSFTDSGQCAPVGPERVKKGKGSDERGEAPSCCGTTSVLFEGRSSYHRSSGSLLKQVVRQSRLTIQGIVRTDPVALGMCAGVVSEALPAHRRY